MDCIVGDEDICVEVTEADEAVRDVLWFLTGDDKLPSVDAERTFLVYRKDGRDVGVCVEIKILRRRPPRHRRAACSMAWRCRFLAARSSQDGRVSAKKRLIEELSGAPDPPVDFHTGLFFAVLLLEQIRQRRATFGSCVDCEALSDILRPTPLVRPYRKGAWFAEPLSMVVRCVKIKQ